MSIQPANTGPTSSTQGAVVSPSDSVDLANLTKGVYVGGAGDMKVTMQGGQAITFKAVPVGTYLNICVSRIWSTGTTASNLLALWE